MAQSDIKEPQIAVHFPLKLLSSHFLGELLVSVQFLMVFVTDIQCSVEILESLVVAKPASQ